MCAFAAWQQSERWALFGMVRAAKSGESGEGRYTGEGEKVAVRSKNAAMIDLQQIEISFN